MPSKKAHSKHFSRTSRLYRELQKICKKFLQGVGPPQMFLAPGLALPKTATAYSIHIPGLITLRISITLIFPKKSTSRASSQVSYEFLQISYEQTMKKTITRASCEQNCKITVEPVNRKS